MQHLLKRKNWEASLIKAGLLQNLLLEKKATLAVAESCTGGLVSALLTSIPGSSQYFLGGVVTYANEAKSRLLKVRASSLEQFGAVSAEVAAEMAVGVAQVLGSTYGISLTGIAGPGGGSTEKPVGTVWCGLAYDGSMSTFKDQFIGNREEVRWQAAIGAIDRVYKMICATQPISV